MMGNPKPSILSWGVPESQETNMTRMEVALEKKSNVSNDFILNWYIATLLSLCNRNIFSIFYTDFDYEIII